jgi:thioredoxin 1
MKGDIQMSVISVNSVNFNEEVINSSKPVLVDLWATWCGPCRMMAPVLDEIASEHPEVKVCKINVDEEPELARSFRVSAIPTVALIKNGKVVDSFVGFKPKSHIKSMLV